MTHPNNSKNPEATPSIETPSYKKLKFAIVFMGMLIVLGLAVIVTTIIYRAMGLGKLDTEKPKDEDILILSETFKNFTIYAPEHGVLKSVNGSGGILYLHFTSPKGDIVKVLNTKTGENLSEVIIAPSK
ncbi:MAG: hypothetical protein ACKVIX_02240 [Sphingomonadales bacterium]|jgi:hypothetical protein